MASPYSQPTQFTPYQELVDKNLLSKALAYRQEKYDFNRAKVQEAVQKISSLDFAKSQDEEYFYNRLQNIENAINQYGSGDLSLDSRSDYLTGFIGQSVDDRVMNGYMGTLAGRNINSGAQASMEEGLYDERNHAYSLQDYNKWASDGQTGSQFKGNSNYIEFTDFDAMIRENVLDEIDPEGFVSFDDVGNYTFFTQKGEMIEPETIKNRVSLYIANNPNVQRQLRINSWAQFQGMDDETFFAQTQANISTPYESLITQLSSAKYDLAVSTYPEKSAKLAQEIQVLESGIKTYNNSVNNRNRPSLEYQLYTNDLLNGYAEAYQRMSITDMGFETNDGALRMAIHNDDMAMRRQEMQSANAKEYYEAVRKGYADVINAYNSGDPSAAKKAEQLFNLHNTPMAYLGEGYGNMNPLTDVYGLKDFADFVNKEDNPEVTITELTGVDEMAFGDFRQTMEDSEAQYAQSNKDLAQLYTTVWGDTPTAAGGTVMDLFRFTPEQAAELGKPELAGTINYTMLSKDFAREDGFFSEQVLNRYNKAIPSQMPTGESFGSFKIRYEGNIAEANQIARVNNEVMGSISESVTAWLDAAEGLTEGNAVQEFFRSNPTIELAGGTLTRNPGEDFYRFNVDFPLFGNPELTDWQTSILVSKGGKLDNQDYQLTRKEVEFLLGEELVRKEGRLDMSLPSRTPDEITLSSGSTISKDQIENINLATIQSDMNAVFKKRFGDIIQTSSYTVSSGSPASRNQASYILKIANAQGLDLGGLAPYQDGEVIRSAMEATQKLDEEGNKSMGDLGVRGMRYGLTAGGGNAYVEAEVFDADDGEFVKERVVIPKNTIPVGTSLFEELEDDYQANKQTRRNFAYETTIFDSMKDGDKLVKTYSSFNYGPARAKDERGITVEYTNVNLQTAASFVKSDAGNTVGPVVIFKGTKADGSITTFSYEQYVNQAKTFDGTLEILGNSIEPLIQPGSPSYNPRAVVEIISSPYNQGVTN